MPSSTKQQRTCAPTTNRNATVARDPTARIGRDFERRAQAIMREWFDRVRDFSSLTADQRLIVEHPDDWMRRSSYRLIRNLILRDQAGILPALVAKLEGQHRRGRGVAGQPFKQGLLVMQILVPLPSSSLPALTRAGLPEAPKRRPVSDEKRRNELGDAMHYAHLHGVQSRYFNAFRRHVGAKRIRAMLKNNLYEPGFKPKAGVLTN